MANVQKTEKELARELNTVSRRPTELAQIEEALRESEAKYRQIFNNVNAVIVHLDKCGKIIEINSKVEEYYGFKREELIGKHFTKIGAIHLKDLPKLVKFFAAMMRGETIANDLELETKNKSGDKIMVQVNSGLLKKDGKIEGTVAVVNNITARKEAEESLKESEGFNSTLLTNTPSAIFVTYPDGTIKYVNPAFEKLTGFSLAEIIGTKTPYPWWPRDKKDEIEASLKETVPGEGINPGEGFTKQMTFQKKNGELFTVDLNATVINKNGKREYILVTWVDNSERNKAEKALQESEEKFSKAFSSSANAISITSLEDNRHMEINESFTRFTGYSREEAIGHSPKELNLWVKPTEKNRWLDAIQKDGRVYNQEFSSRHKSGDIRIGLGSAEVITIGGKPHCIVTIADITEQKKVEEKLKQALTNLEQSSARLAAANKELEAFSYSVSHDLRSPLRSIDGFSQALLEDYADKLDVTAQDYLRRLCKASQKMGELIDGLLNLSRLTRSEMHREKVDLSALAGEIASQLRESGPERKVEFIISSGLSVYGDPQLLRVLLGNLLSNAWKFTGKVPLATIEFGATRHGTQTTFFVRDNGAGFDMKYIDKLFGAFQRLHDTTEFPGTGIGLATVQRIINRHGGTVRAEGDPGKGATFYFTLD